MIRAEHIKSLWNLFALWNTGVNSAPNWTENEVRLTRLQVELNTIIIVPKKEQM